MHNTSYLVLFILYHDFKYQRPDSTIIKVNGDLSVEFSEHCIAKASGTLYDVN